MMQCDNLITSTFVRLYVACFLEAVLLPVIVLLYCNHAGKDYCVVVIDNSVA